MRTFTRLVLGGVIAAASATPDSLYSQCQKQGGGGGGGQRNSTQRFGGPNTPTGMTPGRGTPNFQTPLGGGPGLQFGFPRGPGVQNPIGNPQVGLNNPLAMPPQLQLMIQQQQQQAAVLQGLRQLAVQQTTPVLQNALNNPNAMVRWAAASELSRRDAALPTYSGSAGQ